MNFLPDNYESPKDAGNWMKLQEGENRIRILTKPIIGWEDWMDKKPIRFHYGAKPSHPVDPKKAIKHFWAMVVWNYSVEKIQILEVTQASIRKPLESLAQDKEWGAPFFYDIKIKKEGEGVDTEYSVSPVPHKKTPQNVIDSFNAKPCFLDAMFKGEDPFVVSPGQKPTPGIFYDEGVSVEETVDMGTPLERIMQVAQGEGQDPIMVVDYVKERAKARQESPETTASLALSNVKNFFIGFQKWKDNLQVQAQPSKVVPLPQS